MPSFIHKAIEVILGTRYDKLLMIYINILVSYSPPFNIPSSAEPNGYRYQTVFLISVFHITYADNAHTNRAGHQLQFTKGVTKVDISKRPV